MFYGEVINSSIASHEAFETERPFYNGLVETKPFHNGDAEAYSTITNEPLKEINRLQWGS